MNSNANGRQQFNQNGDKQDLVSLWLTVLKHFFFALTDG
jgi:hypothetical protein